MYICDVKSRNISNMKFKHIIYYLFISCLIFTACTDSDEKKENEGIDEALLDFNTQQLRESLKNPPIIQEPIDFDYVPQTG